MAQQTAKQGAAKAKKPAQDNLVNMQSGSKENQVLEINKQMSTLETSINRLSRELTATNKQVKSEVERLATSDADISDKVTDTFKQLGAIENTFEDLSAKSNKIGEDLKSVNSSIRSLEKDTRSSLDDAIENQTAINDSFKSVHEELIAKAEKLSKKATAISKKLDKSIKDNSKAIAELEAKVAEELEVISKQSEQRDLKLDEKISAQKAKMLVMQGVDEALQKRADALEGFTQQLSKDSRKLKNATEVLDVLTSKLSTDVENLELHTQQLAAQNEAQQGQIDGLEDRTDSLGRTLLALASLEKKHFRILGGASLVLLLALLGAFFYGEYMRDTEVAAQAQTNGVVDNQISDLQNRVEDEQIASQVFYQEISALEQNLDQVKGELQDRLQQMTDQVESIDGRVQYIAPLYNFGSNNTIHGSQWITELNPEHKSIKIATVSDKQELYDIAQRYNNHFTEELAYFITADGRYTLIYGGRFDDDAALYNLMRRMPAYINGQQIEPISNARVLEQIKS